MVNSTIVISIQNPEVIDGYHKEKLEDELAEVCKNYGLTGSVESGLTLNSVSFDGSENQKPRLIIQYIQKYTKATEEHNESN